MIEKKKTFADKRWHDDPKAEVVGKVGFTEEENKKYVEKIKKEKAEILKNKQNKKEL